MLTIQAWKDSNAPAAALLACFVKKYGAEALEWEPEVARKQIEEDYGIKISNLQSDKLQAAIAVLTTEGFETDWLAFQNICHIFANIPDSFEDFEPLDPEEIIDGISQATLIRNEQVVFHDEINAYVGVIFHEHGFSKAPVLFPTAIMPKCNEVDDKDKNDALEELFDYSLARSASYLEGLE